ncbi:MAG: HesB/IscA family protein [Armatimonadota bacterium]
MAESANIVCPVRFTESAIKRLRAVLAKQGDAPDVRIRLGVRGGGCSGLSYVLDVDTKVTDKDDLYEVEGLPVVIDRKSKRFLEGTVIDYSFQNLLAGFIFHNPNAERSCGCGSSFTPKMTR